MSSEGRKYDNGKPRWSLLPWEAVEEVVKVLTHGAEKYEDDNWKRVPKHRDRYISSTMRHFTKWILGEKNDPDSGFNHLACATCGLLFLLWMDLRGAYDNEPRESYPSKTVVGE